MQKEKKKGGGRSGYAFSFANGDGRCTSGKEGRMVDWKARKSNQRRLLEWKQMGGTF